VKEGKIKSMEEIYLHSLPIKEYQIVDFFLPKLKDEVMKVGIAFDLCCVFGYEHIGGREMADEFCFVCCRSSPSRSRLVLVNAPGSRPSWSLATRRDTSVSVSRPPKKLLPLSVPPSSSLS
jgi:hypothetical protein